MSSDWTELKLGEIVTFKTGKLDSNAAEKTGEFPFFTCSPNTLAINSFAFDTEAVILAGNNANGVFSIKHYSGKFNAYQRTYVIEPINKETISCRYAYFLLSQMIGSLKELSIGSATKFLTKTILNALPVRLPPKSEQDEIAYVLSALDDRISLLRETNTTLEAIAQALFKSWFVDFDPVHAKMQGRAPEGMDEATAALFPDSFEDSELGPVPKGWKVGTLDTLAKLNPESWSTKNHPELIHYVDLANTKAGQIEDMNEFSFDEAPSRARRVLKCGDVIVGTVRPSNRSFARISVDIPGLTGSTGFAVLRPSLDFDQALTYIAATCHEAIDRLSHLADGGAYPAVRPEVVGSTPIVIAPELIRKAFGEITNTLYESIGGNQELMKHLATLRDTLLPRLISGELSISDTAKHAEGARA